MLTKREFEQVLAAIKAMNHECSGSVLVPARDVLAVLAEFTEPKPSTGVWMTKADAQGHFVHTNWKCEWPRETP